MPEDIREAGSVNSEVLKESGYNLEEFQQYIAKNKPLLTQDQREVYEMILSDVNNAKGGIIFLGAPGKTFTTNLLLSAVRVQRKIVLALASSGIAATLLPGGRTAHSNFKLPLDLHYNEVFVM